MHTELTFSIIKPDAVKRNLIGQINTMIEGNGFKIVAQKMVHLSQEEASGFYIAHKDRPFYGSLVKYMSSYPIVVQVLQKYDAVSDYRKLMGSTDPFVAEDNTIRKSFGINIEENSVHGSDSLQNAKIEIDFFFDKNEIFKRD